MTREEANQKLWATRNINTLSKVECDNILNEVYEDFENRTCNNCKAKNCSIKRVLMELEEINPDYFSCNDWEQK